MISTDQTQQLLNGGGVVVDNDGSKIGSIGQVYLDDQTGQPEWITVKTGMFGGGESFVPLREADVAGNDLRVPYDKDMVKGAPRIADADSHLSETEESELYRYYGVGGAGDDSSNDTNAVAPHSEAGRVRLRRYVVTESVTTTVPVSHEEVRLEREPITDGNVDEAMSGGDITSEEHDIVLTEEQVELDENAGTTHDHGTVDRRV